MNVGRKDQTLTLKIIHMKEKRNQISMQTEWQRQSILSCLRHLKKECTILDNSFQDIGYQTRKGSDPWETRNKWAEPTTAPADRLHSFQTAVQGEGTRWSLAVSLREGDELGAQTDESGRIFQRRELQRQTFGDLLRSTAFRLMCMGKLPQARERTTEKD